MQNTQRIGSRKSSRLVARAKDENDSHGSFGISELISRGWVDLSWVLGKNFWGGWTIAGRDKNPLDRLSSKS